MTQSIGEKLSKRVLVLFLRKHGQTEKLIYTLQKQELVKAAIRTAEVADGDRVEVSDPQASLALKGTERYVMPRMRSNLGKRGVFVGGEI